MVKRFIPELPSRLLGFPRTAESLVRYSLILGFLVLLALVGAIGYWSRESFKEVEREIATIHQSETTHFVLVRDIAKTENEMRNEASNLAAYPKNDGRHMAARNRMNNLRDLMEEHIGKVRNTSLAGTAEWANFEATFGEFLQTINLPVMMDWNVKRDEMKKAVEALDDLNSTERQTNEIRTQALSRVARNRIVGATVAALLLGLLVAALTFYEIGRTLKQLGKAYDESDDSRGYLQSLLDSLVSGVLVIGLDGKVQTTSASFRRLTGIASDSAIGNSYEAILGDQPLLVEKISENLAIDSPPYRYYGRVQLGEAKLFDVSASPLLVAGEYRGIILVFVDVTETERAQSELRRNRALAAIGQMTSQIAHEIKNPLGSIRFATEILKRTHQTNGDEDTETLDVIDRSVDHLAAIVSELNEFARPKELNRTEVNLNQLLDDLLPMVADRLEAKEIEIKTEYSNDLPSSLYDATELRKLFLNLIINAIDASKIGGSIEVRTNVNGAATAAVHIIDHGTGMDSKTLNRLFEPFYTTKQTGTGLGMAIAKKIAELHGGDLVVASKQGEGTTVTVKMPLG